MAQEKDVPKEEYYPAKCTFCSNDKLTFHIQDGKKVLDKPCDCPRSASKKKGVRA